MQEITKTPQLTPLERRALEHVWIHNARWVDLAERDGLRVIDRGGVPRT